MSGERVLAADGVPRLVASLLADGIEVYGPATVRERCEYRRIGTPEALDLQAGMPALPLKALFLPPTETLFTWRRRHNDVELTPTAVQPAQRVVIGARPCDAAGVSVLDKVMGWDYRDEAWFARREATTIVALACDTRGPACFCDAVGLAPDSSKGADVLLTRCPEGFRATAVTDKGETLLGRMAREDLTEVCPTERPEARTDRPGASPAREPLDLEKIREWLDAHFDDPLWAKLGLRCHGCGACAAVCPACHCFDIVDEPDGLLTGARRRHWDACQSAVFTAHASGHNPRSDQGARFRQRVVHKFSIYPRRFGERLCTGCGRCAEACPAGQDLADVLREIAAS